MLGWTPDAFWSASLRDVINAVRAFNRANSPKGAAPARPKPMTYERFLELEAIYGESS